jgi:hypothetical protein
MPASEAGRSVWLIRRKISPIWLMTGARAMISEVDVLRAAHLMMHEYGPDAETEAAKYADLMLGRGDRDALLTWTRIWRTIAVMHIAPVGLPH